MTLNRFTHRIALTLFFACLLPMQLRADSMAMSVSDGWIRATPPGATVAAAFLTLSNPGKTDRVLTGVQCKPQLVDRCEIHEHIHLDGRMRMQAVSQVVIPANGSFRFQPGGHHIMLIGLKEPLLPGSTVSLVFTFADQTSHPVQLPVKPIHQE